MLQVPKDFYTLYFSFLFHFHIYPDFLYYPISIILTPSLTASYFGIHTFYLTFQVVIPLHPKILLCGWKTAGKVSQPAKHAAGTRFTEKIKNEYFYAFKADDHIISI